MIQLPELRVEANKNNTFNPPPPRPPSTSSSTPCNLKNTRDLRETFMLISVTNKYP